MTLPPDAHRERLELVLEGTRLGMWDWNPQTNDVVFDSRWAEMLGHTLDEIPFELDSWSSRVHPDDLEGCFADIQAHMNGTSKFYENVHRMLHKDGHWVHILDRGRVCEWDAEGRPTRFTGTHTDISAQVEAEHRARALAQGRTRFLATMSHEIRTPMHGMLGLVGLLQNTELSEEQARLLDLVQRCGGLLMRLVDDILDFSKVTQGGLELVHEPVEVTALVDGVVELFSPRAQDHHTTLESTVAPDVPPWVLADGHRMRQILSNLVSNAVKFTQNGAVDIEVGTAGPLLELIVRDTGSGMADTVGIFEPYDQATPSITSSHGGTGLGLAIVKELVTAMGGEVTVNSVVDQGSAFRVVLPLHATEAPAPVESPARRAEAPNISWLRVLAAEDNPVNQLVLQAVLGEHVAQLDMVGTGRLAVEAVRSGGYDVVLMDLNMPEMDGDVATRLLRKEGVGLPIIAVSADVLPETRQGCVSAGFSGFVCKPFTAGGLLTALHRVVSTA